MFRILKSRNILLIAYQDTKSTKRMCFVKKTIFKKPNVEGHDPRLLEHYNILYPHDSNYDFYIMSRNYFNKKCELFREITLTKSLS